MSGLQLNMCASAFSLAVLLIDEEEDDERTWYEFQNKRKRTIWVRDMLARRPELGFYKELDQQLRNNDPHLFKNFVRMSANDFDFLLGKVTHLIQKQDTHLRKAIPPGERLAITLRYLATGDSFTSLQYLFRVSKSAISGIVVETCEAIFNALKMEYMKVPSSSAEWKEIAQVFQNRWNFPNCIGAIDGKHVQIIAPEKSGSKYYNYKKTSSVILMAMADGEYQITFMSTGACGRDSDGGVFARCGLRDALEENTWNVPPDEPFPLESQRVPYVVVTDDAFPLRKNIMKPFSFHNQDVGHRVFNYRLSRARRIIENVFGICSARFRVLRKLQPEKVKIIVSAICALHNFLIKRNQNSNVYVTPADFDRETSDGIIEGNWRSEVNGTERLRSVTSPSEGRAPTNATQVREEFKNYFLTAHGEVPWQFRRI